MGYNINSEIREKIKKIELAARKRLTGIVSGDKTRHTRGLGLEFDQISEYQVGDDIRFIDWKASARSNNLMVRRYFDTSKKSILIALDVSGSTLFGTGNRIKVEAMSEIAAYIACISLFTNDSVGLILFDEEIRYSIPPKVGKGHGIRLMHEILSYQPGYFKTDLIKALREVNKLARTPSMVVLISDFLCGDIQHLNMIAKKHECIAIRCIDELEQKFPAIGLIPCRDLETGELAVVNSNATLSGLQNLQEKQTKICRSLGVDLLDISTTNSDPWELLRPFLMRRRVTCRI